MVDIDHRQRVIKVKLVYYGPAVGGKTTNLKVLFERAAAARRGQFVSVNSAQDRTILCDLLPLRSGGFRGYDLKVQLARRPRAGHVRRHPPRRPQGGRRGRLRRQLGRGPLAGEPSRASRRWSANLLAQQLDARRIPLVFQYNKRDLPAVVELRASPAPSTAGTSPSSRPWRRRARGSSRPSPPILDPHDRGPLPALRDAAAARRGRPWRPGRSRRWRGCSAASGWRPARGGGGGGAAAEARRPPTSRGAPEGPRPDRRGLGPRGARRPGDPLDGVARRVLRRRPPPSSASWSASCARSATSLRVRLDEVRRALELATEAPGKTGVEARAPGDPAGAREGGRGLRGHAAALHGRDAQVLALPPLQCRPLSRTTWGGAHLEEAKELAEPQLEEASSSPQLAQALRAGRALLRGGRARAAALGGAPPRASPCCTSARTRRCRRPTRLVHLGFLARVLAGPLEASAAREAASAGERLKVLSRASAAAVASLLTRLPWELARRQPSRMADVLAPLGGPGRVARGRRRPRSRCWATRRSCASPSPASSASARPTPSRRAGSPRSRSGSSRTATPCACSSPGEGAPR